MMKTAYFTATDHFSSFEYYLKCFVERFEFLNNTPLIVIDDNFINKDIPKCRRCRKGIKLPWVKVDLWSFVDESVERVVWLDRMTIPVKPLGILPENGLSVVPFTENARLSLFPNFDIHPRFKHCIPLYDFSFFVACKETKPIFEQFSNKKIAPYEFSEEKGYMNAVIKDFSNLIPQINNLPLKYNWLPIYGNEPNEVINLQFKQGMGVLSQQFFDTWKRYEKHPIKDVFC